ncbi:MAG: bifunctional D-glycero-beta-D-manno-heptose-7-phosphate kinase/D-glycero-beta-D-manno-heptose 1-phosphate adenylyltransferase HldE [Methylococcales bacterium]|nr:bifunctional D-glycero-beta-D-manno-heptose-7-phosphate kinase/D-glycero-beta-D-manno-heptose 1-phosphate adenylyltransferase HldE [Methylococcales bacterium]
MQLPYYSSGHVLVIGDLMLDRYWHGSTSRISPEAPVPIVHVNDKEVRAGGAGNVALNITALGGNVSVLGYVGNDEPAQALKQLLQQAGVLCLFEMLDNYPTITKLRIISRHQQLIRLDFEESFFAVEHDKLLHQYHAEITQADVVVLSDYGKGTLSHIEQYISVATQLKKPILIDPKGTNFSIYKHATLVTPNLTEFEGVVGKCTDQQQLVERGMNLLQDMDFNALLVTQGENGMTLLTRDEAPLHLPTHAREVFDVTGAGDTVISVLAASLAAKKSLQEATVLANMGAGIVVGKLGTATVNTEELDYALQGQRAHHRGVGVLAEIINASQMAQEKGEKIVLTNGCFDILHPGHIRYLQQAKALGDRLIVLVNSDDSVKRLKGPERPVNNLAYRMEMLAALECIDWVVPFEGDTPKPEIDQILPNILAKGGDYTDITTIAGHKSVIAHGGEVKILSFIEGHSTTRIIESIRENEHE